MAEAKKNLELPTVALGTQWSWDQDVTNVAQSWSQIVTNGDAAVGPSGGPSGISGLSVQSSLNRLSGQVGHLSGHQMEPSELSKQNVLHSVDGQYGRYGPAEPDASDVHDV